MRLKMRVAVLEHDKITTNPRYWTEETIKKWLADQGFDLSRHIAKSNNWKTKTFYFVQPEGLRTADGSLPIGSRPQSSVGGR